MKCIEVYRGILLKLAQFRQKSALCWSSWTTETHSPLAIIECCYSTSFLLLKTNPASRQHISQTAAKGFILGRYRISYSWYNLLPAILPIGSNSQHQLKIWCVLPCCFLHCCCSANKNSEDSFCSHLIWSRIWIKMKLAITTQPFWQYTSWSHFSLYIILMSGMLTVLSCFWLLNPSTPSWTSNYILLTFIDCNRNHIVMIM